MTQENLRGANEDARRKMEDLSLQDKGLKDLPEGRGEKVVMKVEDSRPGAIAETLKAADQNAAQTFNDVGRFHDEGIVRKK